MPRSISRPRQLVLPHEPDPDLMPIRYGDREQLSQIHERYFGPISGETLRNWPLTWRRVNARSVCEVREFLAEAQRRFDAAPILRRGRSKPAGEPHGEAKTAVEKAA